MDTWTRYFSDQWWLFVWHNFSISLAMLIAILKGIAKVHPGVKSNKIIDLLQLSAQVLSDALSKTAPCAPKDEANGGAK